MSKLRILIVFLAIILSINIVNAQINPDAASRLDSKQQGLVKISALTSVGDLENLKIQLDSALNTGLSINEIKEALVQLYAYCGFPRSLNAIGVFMEVVKERKSKGIADKEGKKIIVENNTRDKYEQGRKVLEILSKTPQSKPAPGFGEFAPRIDAFLKEHLFADIFASDVLSYQQRELTTISALAAMKGVESQLQSHIKIGTNTGLTNSQFIEAAMLIDKHVGTPEANTFRRLLSAPAEPVIRDDMMVRISEIEILPEYFEEYNSILKDEASASLKIEPGVIAIFPMYQKDKPTQVRILEIYADKASYQSHLQTPHFQHYKTTTVKMVKSLQLIDMSSIDKEMMIEIFKKLN